MFAEKIKELINLPDTYIGEAPVAIDSCQWIRASGGNSETFFTKQTFDKPSFSIYVRDANNAYAAARVEQIYKKIRNHTDSVSSLITRRLPSFVGKDDKHRSVYVFSIEYQTGGY